MRQGTSEQHQIVGGDHRDRLAVDHVARTPDRVAQAERLLLADIGDLTGIEQHVLERVELRLLIARHQGVAQLVAVIEVVLNGGFSTAGDEDELLNSGGTRLLDRILDERFVDNRQHFLGQRLGGRQKPGAEAADRKNRLTWSLWHI